MFPSQTLPPWSQQTAEHAVVPEVAILARLLHKLDRQPLKASAEQYQVVASKLAAELRRLPESPWLDALLRRYPEAAEVYENTRYDIAGLCRTPLDQAAAAEIQARELLACHESA
jgi:hypothetical protein